MKDKGLLISQSDAAKCVGVLITVQGGDSSLSGREILINTIRERATEAMEKGVAVPDAPILSIDMCGKTTKYQTYDDIPEVDVPCSCGNPNHWLIKYEVS